MVIGKKTFNSDLIILQDGTIKENWWRSHGHSLLPADITTLIDTAPEKLIIGTGANGLMNVSESVSNLCKKCGTKVEAYRTAEAVARFNQEADERTTIAACFHLTC